jgi:hypothetical protein
MLGSWESMSWVEEGSCEIKGVEVMFCGRYAVLLVVGCEAEIPS